VSSHSKQRKSERRKRRIQKRLATRRWKIQPRPMCQASNIHYDVSDRVRGLGVGGIGALHLLARRSGLIERIDQRVHVLKRHLPYHESDHVLNIAYNLLCGGDCLEDLDLLREDEAYLDALGAAFVPFRDAMNNRLRVAEVPAHNPVAPWRGEPTDPRRGRPRGAVAGTAVGCAFSRPRAPASAWQFPVRRGALAGHTAELLVEVLRIAEADAGADDLHGEVRGLQQQLRPLDPA